MLKILERSSTGDTVLKQKAYKYEFNINEYIIMHTKGREVGDDPPPPQRYSFEHTNILAIISADLFWISYNELSLNLIT